MTKIMKGGVAYNSTSNIVALTQAEYNALSTAQKNNGNFYCITDADPSYFSAENIDYDNTDSGLSAINIQDAIDEIDTGLDGKADSSTTYNKTEVNNLLSNGVYPKSNISTTTDANSLVICGVYRVNGATTNFPNGYGVLVVFSPNNILPSCAQVFFRYDGAVSYYRICWDGANWSNWKQF